MLTVAFLSKLADIEEEETVLEIEWQIWKSTHPLKIVYIRICIQTCVHTYIHTYTHSSSYTHSHTHAHTHSPSYTLSHTNAHTHSPSYTHSHTQTVLTYRAWDVALLLERLARSSKERKQNWLNKSHKEKKKGRHTPHHTTLHTHLAQHHVLQTHYSPLVVGLIVRFERLYAHWSK